MDVAAWLRGLGLEQYAQLFRDNDIDGEILCGMTAEDLRELGINSFGHRRRLLNASAALRGFARKRHRCTKMPDVARKSQTICFDFGEQLFPKSVSTRILRMKRRIYA